MSLTANELADIRAIADDFFPDTCTIQTKTTAVDALGGLNETFASTHTNVRCRLDPASTAGGGGSEVVRNLALEAESTWFLNIPYNQAIAVSDKVVHNSITYDVRYVWDDHSYSTINRALLVRIN